MRVFMFIFIPICLLLSCGKEDVTNNIDSYICTPLIMSEDAFHNIPENTLSIQELTHEGECLTISMYVSGCDSNHEIEMISDGFVKLSLPQEIRFALQDNNLQDCEAIFTIEREFDLSQVRQMVDGDVLITFLGSDKSILYQD